MYTDEPVPLVYEVTALFDNNFWPIKEEKQMILVSLQHRKIKAESVSSCKPTREIYIGKTSKQQFKSSWWTRVKYKQIP